MASTNENEVVEPCAILAQTANGMYDRLLDIKEVGQQLAICPRTVNRMVAAGELPPPVKVRTASRWYLSDVNDYLMRLKRNRDKQQGRPVIGGECL
jgi:predicted DNA-binding transcriptional regulator AlpA